MSPRPILKHCPPYTHDLTATEDGPCCPDSRSSYNGALPFASSSHIPPLESPHVHFPPTPALTQLGMTHSSQLYDRKPIQVLPNSLALPERGEREVGLQSDGTDAPSDASEFCDYGYFHPMRYLASNAMDVDSVPSPSSNSDLISPEPAVSPAHSTPSRALETMSQNSLSFDSKCVFNQSSELDMDRYTSLSAAELSASISISFHFSHPVNDSIPSPSFSLPQKRDLENPHSLHRKKPKRRKEAATCSDLKFGSRKLDGCGLGVNYLSNNIEENMGSDLDTSDGGFTSLCQPAFEGCLGGF